MTFSIGAHSSLPTILVVQVEQLDQDVRVSLRICHDNNFCIKDIWYAGSR